MKQKAVCNISKYSSLVSSHEVNATLFDRIGFDSQTFHFFICLIFYVTLDRTLFTGE